MKFTALFVLALFGVANAGFFSFGSSSEQGGKGGHGGSSSSHSSLGSSGLRTIAQGSAHQANSAVAQQHAAARQASYVAKSTLANQATQAAATAQAALAGKQVLLEILEQQYNSDAGSIDAEIAQLHLAQQAAAAAKSAAQQAQSHVSSLTNVLNYAQELYSRTEAAAHAITSILASQTQMVEKAKQRAQGLNTQLELIRVDYFATKEAAEKATLAAQEAQNNAAAAGAHAAHELEQSAAAAAAHAAQEEYEIKESYESDAGKYH